jgi:hypothetical protein
MRVGSTQPSGSELAFPFLLIGFGADFRISCAPRGSLWSSAIYFWHRVRGARFPTSYHSSPSLKFPLEVPLAEVPLKFRSSRQKYTQKFSLQPATGRLVEGGLTKVVE